MTATELFELHVTRELADYRGNVKGALQALDRGDLPGPDSPEVLPHIGRFKRYLARKGKLIDDPFLLWYGILVPGILRGVESPLAVLEPERGGFSDKRLVEAEGQIGRLCQLLTLGRLLVSSLSTDTATAFRQLAERIAGHHRNDELWVRAHAQLSPAEAGELAARALACLNTASDLAERILSALASLRFEPLGDVTQKVFDRGKFWPPFLYRGASESLATELVRLIENGSEDELTHLLFALAWTRGQRALRFFREWKLSGRAHPTIGPACQPEDAPLNAGWCLDQQGNLRELVSTRSCHLRIAAESRPDDAAIIVPCRITADANCPNCPNPLAWLFDFTTIPDELSLQGTDFPPRILCCLHCSCYGTVFAAYDGSGTARWHSTTALPGERGYEPSPLTRQLVTDPYPPFAGADTFGLDDATTLGGVPCWVQNANHPECPECKQFMPFFAQHDNMSLTPPEEGTYYAFFCYRCRISAVTYQQT